MTDTLETVAAEDEEVDQQQMAEQLLSQRYGPPLTEIAHTCEVSTRDGGELGGKVA